MSSGLTQTTSDEILAERALGGDRDSFNALLDRHAERVFRFVIQRLRNQHDAEEATQETFLKIWTARERYDARRSFTTWLFAIAYRESVNVIRKRRATPDLDIAGLHAAAPTVSRDKQARDEQEGEVWRVAARVLDDETYLALYLRYATDRTPRDIAVILGRTGVWVRVALHRARERIGEAMAATLAPDETYRLASCTIGGER